MLYVQAQYIIKPPHAGELSAFPWHQDSNWLRECDVEVQPYLSVSNAFLQERSLLREGEASPASRAFQS